MLRGKGEGWGRGGESWRWGMMRGSSEQLGNKGSRIERDHKSEIETDELGEIVLTE